MTTTNTYGPPLPGLRLEAAKRLTDGEGDTPLTHEDAAYVGYLLRQQFKVADHPLIRGVEYDLEILQLGKAAFVVCWLSRFHAASQFPALQERVARYLLGHEVMPGLIRTAIRQALSEAD